MKKKADQNINFTDQTLKRRKKYGGPIPPIFLTIQLQISLSGNDFLF